MLLCCSNLQFSSVTSKCRLSPNAHVFFRPLLLHADSANLLRGENVCISAYTMENRELVSHLVKLLGGSLAILFNR